MTAMRFERSEVDRYCISAFNFVKNYFSCHFKGAFGGISGYVVAFVSNATNEQFYVCNGYRATRMVIYPVPDDYFFGFCPANISRVQMKSEISFVGIYQYNGFDSRYHKA